MKFFKWIGKLIWFVLWGQSGQAAPESLDTPDPDRAIIRDLVNRLIQLDTLSRREILDTLERENPARYHAVQDMLREIREAAIAYQPSIPTLSEEPAPLTKRERQEAWQAMFQDAVDAAKKGHGSQALTCYDMTVGLPDGLKLTEKSLIDPSTMPNRPVVVDRSEFPAYLRRLHEEAMNTDEGKFVQDRQDAAERYAKKLGLDLEDPAVYDKAPAKLKPHVRYIKPEFVNHQHHRTAYESVRQGPQERSERDA
jgi:hypothetical protein